MLPDGPAAHPAAGTDVVRSLLNHTAEPEPLSRPIGNADYIARLKRAGLSADQVVSALLHEFRIDPHGAGRARELYAAAPEAPRFDGVP